jgi:uncharacterized protein (DUF1499 family)
MNEPADLRTADKGSKPNRWLIAPAGFRMDADEEAPVFGAPPAELFAALKQHLEAEAKATGIETDEGRLALRYTEQVLVFRDDVDVNVVPSEGGSSLAVFSRSRVGYGDFGVNRRRARNLIAALQSKLARP